MTIELRRSDDLRRVARELRRMDNPEIKKRFRKELRAAARPLVPKVRESIRSIPSGRGYSPDGLRGALSKAVRLEVKTTGRQAGVAIRVDGRKMPSHMKSLPSMVEGKKRWRHPVFGNRDVWVTQTKEPYFYSALRVAGPASRRAVSRVLDGITRDIS
ncbi:hypothetical protein [Streptomyces asiaticus]|uniref:hypothetical protein n=1 Tax=Streptomyces asiaticus TaxID=114695 RepID=UPI001BA780AE|nr:hypothetical protein [Streptomyces asiaticus]